MLEPALVALTSTPSIAVSSAELTRPVSAAGACAEAVDENATAKLKPKAKPARRGRCMGSSPAFFHFRQHRLYRLRAASLPSSTDSEGTMGRSSCCGLAQPNSKLAGRTVGTCQHNGIAIGIVQPALPVVRSAAAGRRITVARQENVRLHLHRTGNGGIEIVHLKPEQDAIAVGLVRGIADPAVVMFDIEPMQ